MDSCLCLRAFCMLCHSHEIGKCFVILLLAHIKVGIRGIECFLGGMGYAVAPYFIAKDVFGIIKPVEFGVTCGKPCAAFGEHVRFGGINAVDV